jgi:hypothetical protein
MADERVLEQARAVWRAAMERDDAFAAVARQRRLAHRFASQSDGAAPSRAIAWHAVAMGALIAVGGWAVRGPAPAGVAPVGADAAGVAPVGADAAVVAPVAAGAAGVSRAAQTPPASEAPPALVALAPCFGCTRAGSEASGTAPGERLVPGERVRVPRGSTLILCFGIGAGAGSELEVSGPATVIVTSSGTVAVEPVEPVAWPGGPRTESVPVPDGRGESSSTPAEWDVQWRAAQAALRAGERAAAERRLRALLALPSVPPAVGEQASFALAELELARGAKDGDAESRLEVLRGSADAALAADAVFLEAQAAGSPRERAALYARYVATDPPTPYRERAVVDEGLALLEAGDAEGARARVAALRARGAVPRVVAEPLARLERALAAK